MLTAQLGERDLASIQSAQKYQELVAENSHIHLQVQQSKQEIVQQQAKAQELQNTLSASQNLLELKS